ncbi:MAG: glutamine-hydrolyzing carbamoyl-phosphate synthase small subunit [Bacillota bacterium]|nr:glutamine-hydrolyzing carbamoyl-phosphate synthase small subunit [Bacillota bacterium]
MRGKLALEDGYVLTGETFGGGLQSGGEIVFNTSMTGYQEILTDPSYCGQIIVLTYPLIGNYGVAESDCEAPRSFARGLVCREVCDQPSNWHLDSTLDSFLKRHRLLGLAGVDTRALVRHIRDHGTMRAVIAAGDIADEALVARARALPVLSGQLHVASVSPREIRQSGDPAGRRIVLYDLGSKAGIARELDKLGFRVISVPHDCPASEVRRFRPAGVVLSNGPGDPVDVMVTVEAVRDLIGRYPLFGICLGHQILGLAFGARTYKLKFGHRGANHPVRDLGTRRVYITAQNHGFAVDPTGLPIEVEVSHVNLNDETVEGLRHRSLPIFSVQYHPEASPGPRDSAYLFDHFAGMVSAAKAGRGKSP